MEGSYMDIVPPPLPTQTQVDTQLDLLTSFDENDEEEDENEENEENKNKITHWARLMSISKDIPPYDLILSPSDSEGRQGLHKLGRSVNNCNIIYPQKRISNIHCLLFCEPSATDKKLIAYIEDNSANGTFVNKVKLDKGVRRILRNGDSVSLINPDVVTDKTEIEKTSFYIHLFLEDGVVNSKVVVPNMPRFTEEHVSDNNSNQNNNTASISHNTRSKTVAQLLTQRRNITDYYQIGELLGSGANGQVYSGIHLKKGHEVAIKLTDMRHCHFTSGTDGTGDTQADRVLKEAHMLRTLVHPQIIRLEDVFVTNTTLYMVMDLVKGGDLFDRVVARGRYTEENACMVVLQLVSAIAYMHERNIAHRDLKPENILLVSKDSDVNIKVTDFGLAKSTTENGGLKTYCGTPQYFAPEVLNQEKAEGNTTYSLPADMWSIGVITYALLSGRLPWSDDDRLRNQEILKAKYSFRGTSWDSVTDEAKDFITKLLKKDPNERLTAEQAFNHRWFDSLSHLKDKYKPQSDTKVEPNGNITIPTPILPLNNQIVKAKRKGKRNVAEVEGNGAQLQSIAEESAGEEDITPSPKKISRRQSAMEIATTIDHSKPVVSSRPRRNTGKK